MYQHVMVPLDGSELAECVLPHVRAIALGCNIVKVTLVRVVEPLNTRGGREISIPPTKEKQQLEKRSMDIARDYLEQIEKSLKKVGVAVQSEVLHGVIVDKLIDYANTNEVDLIIVSTHGRSGVSRWVWGSVTDRILRGTCVPITMIRAPGCIPGI